jgi:hypothetical protein
VSSDELGSRPSAVDTLFDASNSGIILRPILVSFLKANNRRIEIGVQIEGHSQFSRRGGGKGVDIVG